ncbi:MAG: DUF1592 domain-containing protein [Myxococcales bacterium]|nr:DUF1592 domain-containing protein [Myxococcales bacterium]
MIWIAGMGWLGCGSPPSKPPLSEDEYFEPQLVVASLHRMSQAEYRTSVRQLLGVEITTDLPVDLRLHGFASVGGSQLTIAAADLDRYEVSAWQIATDVLPDAEARDAAVGCALEGASDPEACIAPWAVGLAHRAWRRPIDEQDLDRLVGVFTRVQEAVGDPTLATQSVLATVLQSPWFLFRVVVGSPDAQDPELRHLTDHEVAARLAALLTGGLPDAALLADADAGVLDSGALEAHARRLLDAPDAEPAMARFVEELMNLDRIDELTKNAEQFPDFTPTLRAAMAEEIRTLFVDGVLHQDADLASLFTTDEAWLTPELARHYGVTSASPASWVTLPADQERGGLLGRAGFLALHAHQSSTSPTHRGLFVRTRLLCGNVPPPPPGVVTELPEPEPGASLRERLEVHRTDPQCSGCHELMDPIGLTFEHFDATGAWRSHDNGVPVDARGDLDGVEVESVADLGRALAEHPDVATCLTRQWLRHAIGQHEGTELEPAIAELSGELADAGHRLRELLVSLASHPAFRTVAAPVGAAGAEGDCSPRTALPEQCTGFDDDCDGVIDEAVRVCEGPEGPGIERCGDAGWSGVCVHAASEEGQ